MWSTRLVAPLSTRMHNGEICLGPSWWRFSRTFMWDNLGRCEAVDFQYDWSVISSCFHKACNDIVGNLMGKKKGHTWGSISKLIRDTSIHMSFHCWPWGSSSKSQQGPSRTHCSNGKTESSSSRLHQDTCRCCLGAVTGKRGCSSSLPWYFKKLYGKLIVGGKWNDGSGYAWGIACREGLSLVEDLMIHNVVIALDSKQVINDIGRNSRGNYGAIISEIRQRASLLNE